MKYELGCNFDHDPAEYMRRWRAFNDPDVYVLRGELTFADAYFIWWTVRHDKPFKVLRIP